MYVHVFLFLGVPLSIETRPKNILDLTCKRDLLRYDFIYVFRFKQFGFTIRV